LDGEHRHDVGAGIAGVADAVVITIRLRGVRGRGTIVERVAHAVAVAVRLPRVGRAAGIRAGAHLREVTAGCHGAAGRACGDECVGRTVIPDAVAVLGDVACPGCWPADGAGRHERVGRAVVAHPVAALRHVANPRGGPADGGALGIGGTVDARTRAVLRQVANSRSGPTQRPAWRERVRRTVVADAVAALRHVAHPGRGPADGRALRVGRTAGARPGTALREVADAGCGTTRCAGGDEAVGRTGVADTVAALRHVADACRRPAD